MKEKLSIQRHHVEDLLPQVESARDVFDGGMLLAPRRKFSQAYSTRCKLICIQLKPS